MDPNNLFFCIVSLTLKGMIYCAQDEDAYRNFPDIFYKDNFYECSKNKSNAYCTANMKLFPKDANSKLWKQIEDWSLSWHHFNRSVIHRTLCIPGKYISYPEKKCFFESKINEELKPYDLIAEMFSVNCKEDEYFISTIVLIVVLIYISFVLLVTTHDQTKQMSTIGQWLNCFSLTSNLKNLTSNKNPDYQRLKCIQGIRTYQTTLVIFFHVMLASGQSHIKNTEYVEQVILHPISRGLITLLSYVIQTYFVISTWLLTNQVLEMYKKNGGFSLRDGLVLFFHRISRFWAPLLVMIYIGPNIFNLINGPGNFEITNTVNRTCRKNGWATFFQVTNFLQIGDVCNLGMWSLSVDTQFYIICIVFLYLVLNYQLDIKECLACMFVFTYIVNVVMFYQKELPLLTMIIDLKYLKHIDFYRSEFSPLTYYGFWINAGSSLIGILFGYFYFLQKNNTKVETLEILCGPIFATFPVAAILIGSLDCSKLVSVLLGPLLKPLFAFGMACGIYGMAKNAIQGWPKLICENKYAVWLGNFTFSIYVQHFLIVFTRGANNTSLVEISLLGFVASFVIDLIQSFALGIFCALIIEQPGINIKKMILPQVTRKEEQCNGDLKENKQN